MKPSQKPAVSKRRGPNTPSPEGLRAEKALKKAVADAVEEHRRLGLPIAVMRKGKAVYVRAEEMVPAVQEPKAKYQTKRQRG